MRPKIKYECPPCKADTKVLSRPLYSKKLNAFFCSQECYEQHQLDIKQKEDENKS